MCGKMRQVCKILHGLLEVGQREQLPPTPLWMPELGSIHCNLMAGDIRKEALFRTCGTHHHKMRQGLLVSVAAKLVHGERLISSQDS